MIQLPQELVDETLDRLKGESSSLKSCSLVCRSWVLRSRRHLFEHIRLDSRNILVLRDLLRRPNCTLSPHVCSIEAIRCIGSLDDHSFDESAADLRHLINVRTLELALASHPNRADPSFCKREFFTAFPSVTRLVLSCGFDSLGFNLLVDMICLFPALQELHTREVSSAFAYSPTSAVPPRELCYLAFCNNSVGPILGWLHAAGHLPNVRSLTLPPVRVPHLSVVRAALQHLGGALQYFDIDVTQFLRLSTDLFDMSLHHNLKQLVIHDHAKWKIDTDTNLIILLISKLVTPALEYIALDVNFMAYRHLNWAALDEILCPTRLPRLQSVVFKCAWNHNHDLHDAWRGALPSLIASGVLRTEW
ncbi:hypothetical protein MVEN_00428600 [Mycena venus]|uniref:F-box domain-containing protein n=1 Tax=Mycena venus TaxID=2733690 RepID=A0A8H6YQU0_9AGAR|nr:hypothetical protein MVEN_00428600 [Mycena venus]